MHRVPEIDPCPHCKHFVCVEMWLGSASHALKDLRVNGSSPQASPVIFFGLLEDEHVRTKEHRPPQKEGIDTYIYMTTPSVSWRLFWWACLGKKSGRLGENWVQLIWTGGFNKHMSQERMLRVWTAGCFVFQKQNIFYIPTQSSKHASTCTCMQHVAPTTAICKDRPHVIIVQFN